MLQRIANEEAAHRACFLVMKKLASKNSSDEWAHQVSGAMLKGPLQDHVFSLDEVNLESVTEFDAMLETAMVLEQDNVIFHEIIASFVTEPDTLRQLKAIIAEEQKHMESLKQPQKALVEAAFTQ
jgi:rubrerythrin